jgi:hypothetical protein
MKRINGVLSLQYNEQHRFESICIELRNVDHKSLLQYTQYLFNIHDNGTKQRKSK